MFKSISGYCPTQNKQYSISVRYIEDSDLEGNRTYIKGLASCEYLRNGNQCSFNECPLAASAPEHL